MKRRCWLIIGVVSLVLGLSSVVSAKHPERVRAIKHLKAIYIALRIYAQNHDGNLPQTLDELVPGYYPEAALNDPYTGQRIQFIGAGQTLRTNNDDRVIVYSSWKGEEGIVLLEDWAVLYQEKLPAEFKRNTAPIPSEHGLAGLYRVYQRYWLVVYMVWLVASAVTVCWIGWAHRNRWGRWRRVVTTAIVFVSLLALPILEPYGSDWWRRHERHARLHSRLQNLNASLQAYSKDHDGQLPNDLTELVPHHLHDIRELVGYDMYYGWVYYGRGKKWIEPAAATNEVLISCASANYDGGFVLRNGGEICRFERADLEVILPGYLMEYARY